MYWSASCLFPQKKCLKLFPQTMPDNKIHINKWKYIRKKMPNKEIRLKVRIDLIYEERGMD